MFFQLCVYGVVWDRIYWVVVDVWVVWVVRRGFVHHTLYVSTVCMYSDNKWVSKTTGDTQKETAFYNKPVREVNHFYALVVVGLCIWRGSFPRVVFLC